MQARTIDERNSAARNGDQPNAFILNILPLYLIFLNEIIKERRKMPFKHDQEGRQVSFI